MAKSKAVQTLLATAIALESTVELKEAIDELEKLGDATHSNSEYKKLKILVEQIESTNEDNGAGSEDFGTKKLFIMHPIGFTFSGTTASKSGATLAELQGGTMYTLAVDIKLSPITILHIAL